MNISNRLNFSKMQALGNDFMVISTKDQNFSLSCKQIQAWSDRHRGVGFDQMLIIKPPRSIHTDYFYQIFNADGTEVGQCGNGARAVALYIHQHFPQRSILRLETISTTMELEVLPENQVSLKVSAPKFNAEDIPILASGCEDCYSLDLGNLGWQKMHCVNVGNPHAIVHIPQALTTLDILQLGPRIEHHPAFPQGCNVNFMHIINDNTIDLRVWERGCGETLACGSGALATAIIARKHYQLAAQIEVRLPGGNLKIICPDPKQEVIQIGPAVEVFQGEICY